MPRRPRLILPGVPMHIIQRGNNRQACFAAEQDYLFYLDWLKDYAEKSSCRIHAYVLMTNHVHILLTSDNKEGVGLLMKRLGQRYVQYFNRCYRRSGTLWEGRFKSCLIQEEEYLLSCQRYIELNPVRAGMVDHPSRYRWSSYRRNAYGETGANIVKPHDLYLGLGKSEEIRQRAYQDLFKHELDSEFVINLRKSTNGNFVLGNNQFASEIEKLLKTRVSAGKSGRPKVHKNGKMGSLF